MTRTIYLSFCLAVFTYLSNFPEAKSESFATWKSLNGDRYASDIENVLETWAKSGTSMRGNEKPDVLTLIAIPTENDDTYIGILAKTEIRASLSIVLSVLKNNSNYKKIYTDLDEISATRKSETEDQIHWKFHGPLGSHTVYDTVQRVERINATKASVVYRLVKRGDVLAADGFMLLQEVRPGRINFLSIDFFNAKWGIAGSLFKGTIWATTFQNTEDATLAIKAASEKLSKSDEPLPLKISVEKIGLADRREQKIFGKVLRDIFEDKDSPQGSP